MDIPEETSEARASAAAAQSTRKNAQAKPAKLTAAERRVARAAENKAAMEQLRTKQTAQRVEQKAADRAAKALAKERAALEKKDEKDRERAARRMEAAVRKQQEAEQRAEQGAEQRLERRQQAAAQKAAAREERAFERALDAMFKEMAPTDISGTTTAAGPFLRFINVAATNDKHSLLASLRPHLAVLDVEPDEASSGVMALAECWRVGYADAWAAAAASSDVDMKKARFVSGVTRLQGSLYDLAWPIFKSSLTQDELGKLLYWLANAVRDHYVVLNSPPVEGELHYCSVLPPVC